MLGYKVMRLSDDEKYFISGANSNLKFETNTTQIKMPGNGIYISTNKQYVLDYYSGLAEKEALITLEFDENTIIFGNVDDIENEISVNEAQIISYEVIDN